MNGILHVISGLGTGGAEAVLVQVASALQGRGVSQHVVSLTGRGQNADFLELANVTVTDLNLRKKYLAINSLLQLCHIIRTQKPRVIQGWMYHGNLFAAFAHRLTGGGADRRLFWGLRASDMDSERYGWMNALSARLSQWPDIIIANSYAGAQAHVGFGYCPRRLEVIHNGINVGRFRQDAELRAAVRNELKLSPDAVVALHVARVDPMKDHATFVSAMAKLPNVVGLLVGKGTEDIPVPPNVRALGLFQPIERLYPAADLIVSSSAFGEGFSNVLAEGMSCGLIPIATDVGDARVIIGDTGHLLRPREQDELASTIASEAQRPYPERQVSGAAARARICEKFPIEQTIEAFQKLYEFN